jgi:cytochrome b561
MSESATHNWPRTVRWLHWLTVLLVLAAWQLAEAGEDRHSVMIWHHTVGALVALLVLTRLVSRVLLPAPEPAPGKLGKLAGLAHFGLLGLLVLQAGTGALSVWLEGETVTFFGQSIDSPLSTVSEHRAEQFEELHEDVIWNLFVALLGLHIAAALFHHWVLGDNILRRMLGRARPNNLES